MNDRERFLATMNYQPRDRCPWWEMWYWTETLDRWHKEGLPEDVHLQEYLGVDRRESVGVIARPGARFQAGDHRGDRRVRDLSSHRRRHLQAVQGRPGRAHAPVAALSPGDARGLGKGDQAAPQPRFALPLPALLGGEEAHLGAARLSALHLAAAPSLAGFATGWAWRASRRRSTTTPTGCKR